MVDGKPDLLVALRHYGYDVVDGRTEQLVLCVHHSEDTPSMSVNAVKGLMNCHACGFAGDSITLVMLKENCDYRTAVEFGQKELGAIPQVPAQRGRQGLSSGSRPARGGYRPRLRKRPGLYG